MMAEKRRGRWFDITVAILAVALVALYRILPDWAAALTIWPAWIPFALLTLSPLVLVRRNTWKKPVVQSLALGAVGLVVMDSPASLFRSPQNAELTVVSLNCAGGIASAMHEVAAFQPDIILLQERPDTESIQNFAKKLFSQENIIVGPDAAVISRWPILKSSGAPTKENMNHAWAIVAHPKGNIAVCSLRFQPPIFRLDLWSPDAWQTYTRNKTRRRTEIQEFLRALPPEFKTPDRPAILGGDFNTPPDWTLTQPFSAIGLRDTFAAHGVGLGGTAVNDYPAVRIDQIWARRFEANGTFSVKTVHSDHRMVVAKLSIPAST